MIMNLINFSPNMMNFDLKYSKSPLSHPSNKKNPQQQPTPTPKFAPPSPPEKKKQPPNLSLCIHLALLKVQESQE